ncbi:MAG: fibronectin type III domain-containing protein [Verrucomicrobiota bacterium]|nr:fibronectin type III domain-containing protein [Verrucomicrobiota bacterium]
MTWNANSEPDLAGYRTYYGTKSGVYPSKLEANMQTKLTIPNLTVGTTYYFVVTAYNTSGLESSHSAEVSGMVAAGTANGVGEGRNKKLVNVSTRTRIDGGDSVMIGGFIVSGDSDKAIVLRAIGPSLTDAGVEGALTDPILELYDSTGALIAENDNWSSLPAQSVPPNFAPTNQNESLISATLAPDIYTAVLRGADGETGVALYELYDLDTANSSVRNISTRGQVGTGADVMIGGFIVGGEEPAQVVVRAIGPSLTAYGITEALPDPILELHSSDGSLIYENDNWRSGQEQQILNTTLQPADDRESAIVATLPPGNYTAVIKGANGSSGVALVEIYNLENP